jgi:hypothetical protein
MKWISVEDRLPIDDESVLVWDKKCGATFGYYVDKDWFLNKDGRIETYISHWQEITPPKEQQ